MTVTICTDEKSAIDNLGNRYEINGLLIAKPKTPDVFYNMEHSLTKAVIFRGLKSDAQKLSNGKINLL